MRASFPDRLALGCACTWRLDAKALPPFEPLSIAFR
jgi:hypothetical protein